MTFVSMHMLTIVNTCCVRVLLKAYHRRPMIPALCLGTDKKNITSCCGWGIIDDAYIYICSWPMNAKTKKGPPRLFFSSAEQTYFHLYNPAWIIKVKINPIIIHWSPKWAYVPLLEHCITHYWLYFNSIHLLKWIIKIPPTYLRSSFCKDGMLNLVAIQIRDSLDNW